MTILWPYVIAIILYIAFISSIAHRVIAKIKTYFEYVLGGRTISCLSFAFLVSAAYVSAVSVLGGSGIAYAFGYVSLVGWQMCWMIALIIATFVGWRLRRPIAPPITLPEAMKTRFEITARRSGLQILSAFWGVLFLVLFNVLQIMGFVIITVAITGLPFIYACLLYILVDLYVSLGGYIALARTNLVHQFFITGGLWGALIYLLPAVGGILGLHEAATKITMPPLTIVPPGIGIPKPLEGPLLEPTPPGALLTAVGTFPIPLLITYMISNMLAWSAPFWPTVLLGSRSMRDMLYGGAVAAVIIGFTWVSIPLLGLATRVLVPTMPQPYHQDVALPLLIIKGLVPDYIGIPLLIGIFAAAISSSAAFLVFSSVFLVNDIAAVLKPLTAEQMFKYSRVAIFVIGLFTLALTILMPPAVIAAGAAFAFGVCAAGLAIPTLLGLYWRRMTKEATYVCLTVPPALFLLIMIYYLATGILLIPLPPILTSLIIGLILAIAVSLITKPPPKESWEPFFKWR